MADNALFEPGAGTPAAWPDNRLLAAPPSMADAYEYHAQGLQRWIAEQRADGVAKGLVDPETGWPTQKGIIDGVRQWGDAMIAGTNAPGAKGGGGMGATMDNPNFAAWFGKSKAVDATGAPLRLYHGTKGDIHEFSPEKLGSATGAQSANQAYFFTDKPHVADTYAENAPNDAIEARMRQAGQSLQQVRSLLDQEFDRSSRIQQARTDGRITEQQFQEQWKGFQENLNSLRAKETKLGEEYRTYSRPLDFGGNIVPVHLKLENPYIKDYGGKEYRDESFNDILSKAKAAGHDGVIFRDVYDAWKMWGGGDFRSDVHAVFDPTQIKSAIGNSGRFDPKDPRITAGIAGLIAGGGAAAAGKEQ